MVATCNSDDGYPQDILPMEQLDEGSDVSSLFAEVFLSFVLRLSVNVLRRM